MFITFEGPEGSGKTTQIALLHETLAQQGYSVVTTREPGGTPIGEQIRTVLQHHDNAALVPEAEILLFSASRAQLVAEVVNPALKRGHIVLSDRFVDSTFAYQGYGHGLNMHVLQTVTTFVTDGLMPDVTFYLAISPEEGLKRRQDDPKSEWNRMDALELAFHKRVHEGYHTLMRKDPERWVSIDAARPPQAIHKAIVNALEKRLNPSQTP
jgi:dTMP kinase